MMPKCKVCGKPIKDGLACLECDLNLTPCAAFVNYQFMNRCLPITGVDKSDIKIKIRSSQRAALELIFFQMLENDFVQIEKDAIHLLKVIHEDGLSKEEKRFIGVRLSTTQNIILECKERNLGWPNA